VGKRLPSLRKQVLFIDVRRAIGAASRAWFRVLHFSVQRDHVHLLVEAKDKTSLSRGTGGLEIRVAKAVNRILGRRGRVWGDRYHVRPLTTSREVRHAIVYVLANWKKHRPEATGFDACSSACWFHGWTRPPSSEISGWEGPGQPVAPATQWLSRVGWKRYGLISRTERPKDLVRTSSSSRIRNDRGARPHVEWRAPIDVQLSVKSLD
jgi:REP element-mobilizing transposase RayT